jgi:hypothetical protein
MRYFKQSLEMKPDYPEPSMGLGLVYLILEQPENAVKQAKALRSLDAEMADTLDALIVKYAGTK